MLFVKAHLSKHFNGLVKKTGLQFYRHWQEMSSTVEDAQQSEPVTLSKGRRPYCVTLQDHIVLGETLGVSG